MERETLHVAVLLGGDSAERDVSIESGRAVARALTETGHRVVILDPVTSSDPIPAATLERWGEIGGECPTPTGGRVALAVDRELSLDFASASRGRVIVQRGSRRSEAVQLCAWGAWIFGGPR